LIPEPPPEYPARVLDRIRLQNFKTHRDTEINLGRLTVLVGPNGSGKSSVLQAIELVGQLRPSIEREKFKTRARDDEKLGECSIEARGLVEADRQPWKVVITEKALPKPPDFSALKRELRTTLLIPDFARLAEPVPFSQIEPKLAQDGFGLAEVVAAMRLVDDASFRALQVALRAVVPQVENIGIRRTQVRVNTPVAPSAEDRGITAHKQETMLGHELTFDVSGRRGIPATMMSGGTMLTVGILALLYSNARPRILLIDDIDHGLHPKAQWDLLRQLRRLLQQFPDLQIVATSHSPDLVDELDPSEVVVLALREDGTSAAKSLSECPRKDMLDVLKAGQLWSAIGEDWVKTADPVEPGQ
jgi:ABC-type branched-subunit amino acid transport system ATPase component